MKSHAPHLAQDLCRATANAGGFAVANPLETTTINMLEPARAAQRTHHCGAFRDAVEGYLIAVCLGWRPLRAIKNSGDINSNQ